MGRLLSLPGLVGLVGLAWLLSVDRRAVRWRPVRWGVTLQIGLGAVILLADVGGQVFRGVDAGVREPMSCMHLGDLQSSPEALSPRSAVITSYALCGVANFASIGIRIGGTGGIAPGRWHDLARLGLRAMIGGTLAAMMTGAVAGLMYRG
ncbi:MAG: nucleoside transporter C-terminal domain-containing protein [Myxococcota bacterium]